LEQIDPRFDLTCNIDTVLIYWIRAFLAERSQAVRIGNSVRLEITQGWYSARDKTEWDFARCDDQQPFA